MRVKVKEVRTLRKGRCPLAKLCLKRCPRS